MALKVIAIGQADQLSTCKVSLLLGVFTSQNLIAYSFKKIDLVAFLPSLMTLT